MNMLFSLLTLFISSINPFLIDVEPTTGQSLEQVEMVQEIMHTKDIQDLVDSLYPEPGLLGSKLNSKEDFYTRCMRGFRQTLIDQKKGWLPKKELTEEETEELEVQEAIEEDQALAADELSDEE